jgi:hypothetical protein
MQEIKLKIMNNSQLKGNKSNRKPRVEFFNKGNDNYISLGSNFLHFRSNNIKENSINQESVTINHHSSFYNQYSSSHLLTQPTLENGGETNHCEIRLAKPEFNSNDVDALLPIGVTLVMDCKISYIRGANNDPHGGGLLSIGRTGVIGRKELENRGLLNNEWHTYCIRIENNMVSVIIDWDIENEYITETTDAKGYLDGFYDEPICIDPTSDTQRYVNSNYMVPRTITLCSHYSNNHQLGQNKLSMYSRVDCNIKNLHVWDYAVTPDHAYSRYIPFIDKVVFPMSILLKQHLTLSNELSNLPLEVFSHISEILWDDSYDKANPHQLMTNLRNCLHIVLPNENHGNLKSTNDVINSSIRNNGGRSGGRGKCRFGSKCNRGINCIFEHDK